MARHRKTSILDDLITAPWWVSGEVSVSLDSLESVNKLGE